MVKERVVSRDFTDGTLFFIDVPFLSILKGDVAPLLDGIVEEPGSRKDGTERELLVGIVPFDIGFLVDAT